MAEKDKNAPPKKERISTATRKKAFLAALKSSLGIISTAMKTADIQSRNTIMTWRRKDKAFDAAMREVEESSFDYVETQLLKRVQAGDTTAIIFYCKTKMKERGYTERTEITGKDGKGLFDGKTDEELDLEIVELTRKLK